MTDHISRAKQEIKRKQQQLADTKAVIMSVGDELASRAHIIYNRSSWDNTIGGLGYNGTWAEVAGLMAELPPSPLVYYHEKAWAATICPPGAAQRRAAKARKTQYTDPTYDPVRAITPCAPFYIRAWRVGQQNATATVHWYVSAKDGLIEIHLEISNPYPTINIGVELIKDGHGHVYDWKVTRSFDFIGASLITAGGKDGTSTDPHFPQYTLWWPEGTRWESTAP